MLFNSLKFAAFFPAVTLGYFVLPHRLRAAWLLAASYLFYMCWNPRYALLMLASTAITWAAGLAMERTARRRAVLAASLALNLGILFVFKYAGFVLDNVNAALAAFGRAPVFAGFSVLLPVGISFYIFQAVGYTIDVYRRRLPAERNFFYYALFVSFFPQLVAGPIERSTHMLPQLRERYRFDYERIKSGLVQMLGGYLEKMVLADRLALLVDAVWRQEAPGGAAAWLAVFFFAMQLYCDFASYSDIAIGAARVMGFDLMRNFNSPYLAPTLGQFWDRWHISLSKWFQDYLYIPLGGSRGGLARTCVNLMIVFLVSGLWHGAAWTFVLWGAAHGAYSVIARLTAGPRARIRARLGLPGWLHRTLSTVWVFLFVSLTLVLFRADSLPAAGRMFAALLRWDAPTDWTALGLDRPDLVVALAAIAVLFVFDLLRSAGGPVRDRFLARPLWVQWPVLLAGLLALAVFGMYGEGYVEQPFIYFQF